MDIYKNLSELEPQTINHGDGLKYVFRSNETLNNKLTQIAFGVFMPNQTCNYHVHETMDEYFFFIKGSGKYEINDDVFEISPNMFIEIKAGSTHKLIAYENLEYVYWGVAK